LSKKLAQFIHDYGDSLHSEDVKAKMRKKFNLKNNEEEEIEEEEEEEEEEEGD